MAEPRRKSKKKYKVRFFLLAFALVGLLIASLVYWAANPATGRLGIATVAFELEADAVIIRREQPVQPGEYARIQFLVDEGTMVSDNQHIANLFLRGYETSYEQLLSKELEVYQRQMTELAQSGDPALLTGLNSQIEEAVDMLSNIAAGELEGDYLAITRILEDLTVARRDALTQAIEAPSNELQTAMTELESMWQSYRYQSEWINTAGSGYISFILDGFEESLTSDQITASQVNRILASSGSASFATEYVYRIVSPDRWQLALVLPATVPQRLVNGQTYTLSADGMIYQATVTEERSASNYITYVLEVSGDVFAYLSVRTTEVKIQTSASGVSIPVEGLTYVEGIPTIYIRTIEGYYPLPVQILAADEKTAIIIAQDPNITITRGMRFSYQFPETTPAPTQTPEPLPTPLPTQEVTALPDTPAPEESAETSEEPNTEP